MVSSFVEGLLLGGIGGLANKQDKREKADAVRREQLDKISILEKRGEIARKNAEFEFGLKRKIEESERRQEEEDDQQARSITLEILGVNEEDANQVAIIDQAAKRVGGFSSLANRAMEGTFALKDGRPSFQTKGAAAENKRIGGQVASEIAKGETGAAVTAFAPIEEDFNIFVKSFEKRTADRPVPPGIDPENFLSDVTSRTERILQKGIAREAATSGEVIAGILEANPEGKTPADIAEETREILNLLLTISAAQIKDKRIIPLRSNEDRLQAKDDLMSIQERLQQTHPKAAVSISKSFNRAISRFKNNKGNK